MELSNKQLALLSEYRDKHGHLTVAEGEVAEDWQKKLQKSDGRILNNAFNILLILQKDEQLNGIFAFNLLTQKPELVRAPPWERLNTSPVITDHDDSCLRNYLSIKFGIKSKDIIYDVLSQVVLENQYHPVRDYLKSIRDKWDRRPRLDTLLIDFMGAEDTELNRM